MVLPGAGERRLKAAGAGWVTLTAWPARQRANSYAANSRAVDFGEQPPESKRDSRSLQLAANFGKHFITGDRLDLATLNFTNPTLDFKAPRLLDHCRIIDR